jgi:flagellar hook protein FlgE
MIGTIHLALSGLQGAERGLRVIANNTANLNTPGFKGSTLMFADMYSTSNAGTGEKGLGLATLGTVLSFQQGQLQNTGNNLDLAIDGFGLFTIRDRDGNIRYTRDGQFKFDANGILVTANTGDQVLAYDGAGALVPVNISTLRLQDAHATENVTFSGTLSTGMPEVTVQGVTVIDRAGGSHSLTVHFTRVTNSDGTWTGAWNVRVDGDPALVDGHTTGELVFNNGRPEEGHSQIRIQLAVPAQDPMEVVLDFTSNVGSSAMGPSSTIAVGTQDGYGAGILTATSFDALGRLVLTYSNGQTTRGEPEAPAAAQVRLALARFDSLDAIRPVGDNRYESIDDRAWVHGFAGDSGFGNVRSAVLEMSNVNLSSEFSNLVILQRGYQASSQVVSTANEMLAELFGMKGK